MGRKAVVHVNGPHPWPKGLAQVQEDDGIAPAGKADPEFGRGGQVGLQHGCKPGGQISGEPVP